MSAIANGQIICGVPVNDTAKEKGELTATEMIYDSAFAITFFIRFGNASSAS